MLRSIVVVVVLAVVIDVTLLVSGYRLLLSERTVTPGQSYVVDGWGDLGKSAQASLVCRYFTGRSVITSVFWYSPNNILGKDSCPFLADAG
jgi:hypothetical protein